MNLDFTLNQALEQMANGQEDLAEKTLDAMIQKIKELIKKTPESVFYLFWARALEVMDENEQAALKYEEAIQLDPRNTDAIWGFANLCLYSLQKPQMTVALIENQLFSIDPQFEGADALLDIAKKSFDPLETVELEIEPKQH